MISDLPLVFETMDTTYFLFFRELGALDILESFELGSDRLQNFFRYDDIHENEMSNEWKFRLPWPMFDMTSVKIPVSFCKITTF